MKIIVTGAAGFIGSHLCERLLAEEQHQVIGIDGFINPLLKSIKQRNLTALLQHPRFTFVNENLLTIDWKKILINVDVIYHLAAMPGVRSSWGKDFDPYVSNNISVTQRLLESCRNVQIKKLIYISTSSIYGEVHGKVTEDRKPSPLSPYGVTKLTGEYLCKVYQKTDNIPVTILRYFTVYGPRQRGDMAFHRFILHKLQNKPIPIYGSGKQTRDFTYVSDCVEATAQVLHANNVIGETINIGGKERASILDIISILEDILGETVEVEFKEKPRGEPMHTWADVTKAEKLLHYKPKISLEIGLQHELEDLKRLYQGGG
ncbi:UDP-glucose 4-epimerase [Anaerobacillus alkalidiazotrophicus]|uniref:UDP-glucose 4-epimerase n=1 Tax=Anaerobacillus alkalidiazotrophicus TaxID=472963 RepID=A0A1S2M2L6_9BACI|nr:NAD-dependent epimerase/dehydratase family protein [Anaerobacillus alkalidiazotrophicus]OIJ18760.1 UDP-glucose 4-epimerase [Anaerobacillus alkalidiazotrophicus]